MENVYTSDFDRFDEAILTELKRNGRISVLELSQKVGLSPTPCGRRIKKLEESGVIESYHARVNPTALGTQINVLVLVKLQNHGPEGTRRFLSAVLDRVEVTECLLTTGDADYVLRVWVRDVEALGIFIRDVLQAIPNVRETSTILVLKDEKATKGA